MIIGIHNAEAGLFSHINFLITLMEEHNSAAIRVEWHSGWLYTDSTLRNVYEALFEQQVPKPTDGDTIRQWPHYDYTSSNAERLYSGRSEWRLRLNGWWRKLHVLPVVTNEVNTFCSGWKSDVVAVHIRNLNIGIECPGGVAPSLEDYEAEIRHFDGRVFLATDNEEALQYFRDRLGARLYARDIPRSLDMNTEYHRTSQQSVEDARNCLVDALIMARCTHLIHSVSNVATAVLYMNPSISHSFLSKGQLRRRARAMALDERLFVARTIVNGAAFETVYVEHPDWSDSLKLFFNGVFVRDAAVEGGLWERRGEHRLRLQWVDWDTEEFQTEVSGPNNASARELMAENTTLYRHQSKIEVIVANLNYGLGNQMFQYAYALSVARERGAELYITYHDHFRNYGLHIFGLCVSRTHPLPDAVLECWEPFDEHLIADLQWNLDFVKARCVEIKGYFQSEKCFLGVAEEVRRQFALPGQLPDFARGRNAVAMHVRLGDYIGSASHIVCAPSYFRSAVAMMRQRLRDPIFLVFSDDPVGAAEYVPLEDDVVIMPTLNEEASQAYMQTCNAFVIANSTFSWWPAWLSGSENVICPDRFLVDREWDICPESWIRIPSNGG